MNKNIIQPDCQFKFSFKNHYTLIVQIRDVETDCALGPHQVGELVVQGPQVMLVALFNVINKMS